ncbi:hypothetical protein GCM10010495_59150 [Kitasatospora herbaricolor]|nr:hypothetical protein GCM10010495_59150 [Kitasatospora herbaricolor]
MVSLRPRRRRGREWEPEPPEGMNHIEETYGLLHEHEEHLRAAHAGFDRRVAAASGTFGWENFSLLVLSAMGFAVAVMTALSRLGWWPYPFGAVGVLCAGLVLLRVRRSRAARHGGATVGR